MTASYKRWEDICERLNVPYRRMGGMIPAFTEKDEAQIQINYEEAKACGVRTEMLTKKQALAHEPMISKDSSLFLRTGSSEERRASSVERLS